MQSGKIATTVVEPGLIDSRASGVLTGAVIETWTRDLAQIHGTDPRPWDLLFDALEVDFVMPGTVIVIVRYARTVRAQIGASALVVRVPTLVGIATGLDKLLPPAPRGIFATRPEALKFLRAHRSPASTTTPRAPDPH